MAIEIAVETVTGYIGVSGAMASADYSEEQVRALIADAISQAIAIAPELAEATGVHAQGAAAIVRQAVARWIIRAASGGRQRTATAGSFSVNESSSENLTMFELSEERKLSELGRTVSEITSGTVQIVEPGLPGYVIAGGGW